ncbi:trehalase isoform X1, partial [Brachionus plicatilis]
MRQILVILLGLCFQSALGVGHSRSIGLCTSNIYCIGDLLHTVQLSGLFQDSKTFVDMPSRFNENQVLDNFSKLSSKNRTQLRKFVEDNFYENGREVVEMDPEDWTPEPSYTKKIKDQTLRSFSIDLNLKWKNLLKMFDRSRICSECESSAILTNNSFIVPGGRFNEYYYWDSYWVIEALLISGMTNTAKGMILNFVDILRLNGFVPNGARVYYLNRSQPPLLIQMVHV